MFQGETPYFLIYFMQEFVCKSTRILRFLYLCNHKIDKNAVIDLRDFKNHRRTIKKKGM